MKPKTTDKTIEEAVRRELEWDPAVSATHIDVTTRDGAVALTGNVPTYAERLAAVAAAQRIYGVRAVADDIEVRLPGTSAGSDAELAETISRQLRANTRVPDTVQYRQTPARPRQTGSGFDGPRGRPTFGVGGVDGQSGNRSPIGL